MGGWLQTHEFIHNRTLFDQKAREMTQKHAVEKGSENRQVCHFMSPYGSASRVQQWKTLSIGPSTFQRINIVFYGSNRYLASTIIELEISVLLHLRSSEVCTIVYHNYPWYC
jgi:hypothetical protein